VEIKELTLDVIKDYEIPINDARAFIVSISSLWNEIKELREAEAIKMFAIGVLIAENSGKELLSLRDIASYIDTSFSFLGLAKRIAEAFDYNEARFLKEYRKSGILSWKTFATKYLGESRGDKIKVIPPKVKRGIVRSLNLIDEEKITQEDIDALRKLRRKINASLPAKDKLDEAEDLKYSICAGCGRDDAPPNGWELIHHHESKYLVYPMCPTCIENKVKPDFEKIAKIYALHSYLLEDIYSQIQVYAHQNI